MSLHTFRDVKSIDIIFAVLFLDWYLADILALEVKSAMILTPIRTECDMSAPYYIYRCSDNTTQPPN